MTKIENGWYLVPSGCGHNPRNIAEYLGVPVEAIKEIKDISYSIENIRVHVEMPE